MWKKSEEFLASDKYISPLVEKYGPCRIKPSKKKEYFSDLVESIVGQQLSMKAADSIFKKVRVGLGRVEPDNILSTEDKNLRDWGLSRAKVTYIKDLAKKVSREEVDIFSLSGLSDEKVIEELVKVKGIGKWTAEMFLMFSLARPDIYPVDDLGIRNGTKKFLGKDIEPKKMVKFAKRWAPHRTVASWYIWRSLENI